MSLTQFSIDDEPHNMDGLRLFARDGTERVEAFIGRKVMDVWADSVEHRGGRQSLFRDQYRGHPGHCCFKINSLTGQDQHTSTCALHANVESRVDYH
jgi:hypothetical protein